MPIFHHMPPIGEPLLCAAHWSSDSDEPVHYHWEFFIAEIDEDGSLDNSVGFGMNDVVWWTPIGSLRHDSQQVDGQRQFAWRDGLPPIEFYSSMTFVFAALMGQESLWKCYITRGLDLHAMARNVPADVTMQFRWLPINDLDAHLDSLGYMP